MLAVERNLSRVASNMLSRSALSLLSVRRLSVLVVRLFALRMLLSSRIKTGICLHYMI